MTVSAVGERIRKKVEAGEEITQQDWTDLDIEKLRENGFVFIENNEPGRQPMSDGQMIGFHDGRSKHAPWGAVIVAYSPGKELVAAHMNTDGLQQLLQLIVSKIKLS